MTRVDGRKTNMTRSLLRRILLEASKWTNPDWVYETGYEVDRAVQTLKTKRVIGKKLEGFYLRQGE